MADAVDLFYNVWKTRGLARAAAWYARRVQVGPWVLVLRADANGNLDGMQHTSRTGAAGTLAEFAHCLERSLLLAFMKFSAKYKPSRVECGAEPFRQGAEVVF